MQCVREIVFIFILYCKLRVMVTMLIVTRCFKFLRMDIFGMPLIFILFTNNVVND